MKVLTWKLIKHPAHLTREQTVDTLTKALQGWSAGCGVMFAEERSTILKANIAFTFGSIRGPENAAAACIDQEDGNHLIIFATRIKWQPYTPGLWGMVKRIFAPGISSADLLTYALHEIGHALGVEHQEDDELSVMYPTPEAFGIHTKPSKQDGELARVKYPYTDDWHSWRS